MQNNELVKSDDAVLLAKGYLVINFRSRDERRLIARQIPTISAQTLMSIAGGCSFKIEDLDFIFMRAAKIRYSSIFDEEQKINCARIFHSNHFWSRIARIIQECFDLICIQGLKDFLLLEIKVLPVLHEMFDTPYPLDAERAKKVYSQLQEELGVIRKQIKCRNITGVKNADDEAIQNLIGQQHKLENKILRFPKELLGTKQKKAYISSKFRSIGTDTFRISTYSTNVQGFPKELRKCLLPRRGTKLVEYDITCSQLILLAGLAGENSLIQYYANSTDLYTFIFSKILQKPQISLEERNMYKAIILKVLFGAGVDTISAQIQSNEFKTTPNDIREFSKKFYNMFPAIAMYVERVKTVEELTLPTGRKYNMNNIKPHARLSHTLQYVEAEILRKILIGLNEKSKELKFDIYLCIHDSIMIETGNEEIIEIREFVQECFNEAIKKFFNNIEYLFVKETLLYE